LAQQGVVVTEEQVGGRVYELHKFPVLLEGSRPGVGGWARDITDRRKAEEALRESEERLKAIFEVLPVGVSILDAKRQPVYANPALARILDISQEGLIRGDHMGRSYLRSDGTPMSAGEFASALAVTEGRAVHDVETGVVKEDGQVTWVSVSAAPVAFPDWSVVVVTSDITERKWAEEELRHSHERIRDLLGHLIRAQEEERARMAADIHDDSIQVMSAVGMRLEALRRRLHDPEALEGLKPLEETVTSAIARLRHLMFELRPRALDEEGLAPALRVYLDDLSEQTRIGCTLANRLGEEPSAAARTVLYRIAQETLVNVRKHANAKRVDVVLEPRAGGYAVKITDDGSGFDLSAAEQTLPGHLGLASMRQRAETAGGWWRIESTPGSGTTVEFWVPAEAD
jgi:PAS domain S-box-containing protein